MIKIGKLLSSPTGTAEPFDLEFSGKELGIREIPGKILCAGSLLRVEGGIMMLIKELSAKQEHPCVRCGKALKVPLPFHPSEWFFYQDKPFLEEDKNESFALDLHRLELDPREAIRQELILNLHAAPHCDPPCKKFDAVTPPEGVKALSGLKDLLE